VSSSRNSVDIYADLKKLLIIWLIMGSGRMRYISIEYWYLVNMNLNLIDNWERVAGAALEVQLGRGYSSSPERWRGCFIHWVSGAQPGDRVPHQTYT
jgi:hypothetical protein